MKRVKKVKVIIITQSFTLFLLFHIVITIYNKFCKKNNGMRYTNVHIPHTIVTLC